MHIPIHMKGKQNVLNMNIASAELMYRRKKRNAEIGIELRGNRVGCNLFLAPEYMQELLILADTGTVPAANVALSTVVGHNVAAKFDENGKLLSIASLDGTMELDVR